MRAGSSAAVDDPWSDDRDVGREVMIDTSRSTAAADTIVSAGEKDVLARRVADADVVGLGKTKIALRSAGRAANARAHTLAHESVDALSTTTIS